MLAAQADVAVSLFTGVTHGFDAQEKSFLSTLRFDAATTATATQQALDLLGPP